MFCFHGSRNFPGNRFLTLSKAGPAIYKYDFHFVCVTHVTVRTATKDTFFGIQIFILALLRISVPMELTTNSRQKTAPTYTISANKRALLLSQDRLPLKKRRYSKWEKVVGTSTWTLFTVVWFADLPPEISLVIHKYIAEEARRFHLDIYRNLTYPMQKQKGRISRAIKSATFWIKPECDLTLRARCSLGVDALYLKPGTRVFSAETACWNRVWADTSDKRYDHKTNKFADHFEFTRSYTCYPATQSIYQ